MKANPEATAWKILFESEKKLREELEVKNEALQELVGNWACLSDENPRYYERETWEKHRQDYLDRINKQEKIIYGESITKIKSIKRY